jgi:hypothetical protein
MHGRPATQVSSGLPLSPTLSACATRRKDAGHGPDAGRCGTHVLAPSRRCFGVADTRSGSANDCIHQPTPTWRFGSCTATAALSGRYHGRRRHARGDLPAGRRLPWSCPHTRRRLPVEHAPSRRRRHSCRPRSRCSGQVSRDSTTSRAAASPPAAGARFARVLAGAEPRSAHQRRESHVLSTTNGQAQLAADARPVAVAAAGPIRAARRALLVLPRSGSAATSGSG